LPCGSKGKAKGKEIKLKKLILTDGQYFF